MIRDFLSKHKTECGAYALVLTLCFSLFVIYDAFSGTAALFLIPGTLLICAAYFFLCVFVEKHRFIGSVLFGFVFFIVVRLFMFFSRYGMSAYQAIFLEWMLTKGSNAEGAVFFLISLFLFFTFFFSVTVYYFSKVLYRMFFLTLISLIPCVLYVKVMSEINNVSLVLIALCNVAVFILHRNSLRDMGKITKKATLIASGAVFMLMIFLVASAIPKQQEAPYYDEFEDLFMGGDTSSDIEDSFSDLSEFSGDASGFLSQSNRKMYSLYGSTASYLKRQNFDYYDFAKDRWYADETYSTTYSTPESWEAVEQYKNLPSLHSALLAAEEYEPGFLKAHHLNEIKDLRLPLSLLQTTRIQSENFGASYFLVPSNVICLDVGELQDSCRVTPGGAFFSEEGAHPLNFQYSYSYYTDYVYYNSWILAGGVDFDNEEALKLLTDLRNVLQENEDVWYNTASSYLHQQIEADYYRELCTENTLEISSELKDFALSLTDGLSNDYEKAAAIESFFQTGGFTYDLQYHAPDDSPEYFLFTGKTGTCSDFASAYVLLARAAGLTVRYAEGYTPEAEGGNRYVIKNRDSHAFPEVFIQNIGWMVFEPTVASTGNGSPLRFLSRLRMDYGLMAVIAFFLVVLTVLATVLRFLLPLLTEWAFRIRLHVTSVPYGTLLAYKRLLKKGGRVFRENLKSKTPHELSELFLSIGCDISRLCHYAEQILYAPGFVAPITQKQLCENYASACKALRRYRKTGRSGNHKADV